MREYGQVQCSFWSDADVQVISDDAKLLAVYLLTGPHSNGIGCYRLPFGYIQADFGWSSERVSKGFSELFEIGFCKRCSETDFVLIPKFLKWNPVTNPNVAKSRRKEFGAVSKRASIHSELAQCMLEHGNHWEKEFETLLNTFAEQDPTRPEPTPPEPKGVRKGKSDKAKTKLSSPQRLFDLWYAVYPNKKAKQDARKAWDGIKPDRLMTARLIRAVRLQVRWREAMRRHDPDAFVPQWKHPAPWLRSGSWEDELEWPKNQRAERKKSDLALTEFE